MLVTQELYLVDMLIQVNIIDNYYLVWTSVDLSRDHKPSEKDESARIKRRGGRIEPYKGKLYLKSIYR